jgi:hypothetical protein
MHAAMANLRNFIDAMPYRRAGFINLHAQLARRVARLSVELENAGSLYPPI